MFHILNIIISTAKRILQVDKIGQNGDFMQLSDCVFMHTSAIFFIWNVNEYVTYTLLKLKRNLSCIFLKAHQY